MSANLKTSKEIFEADQVLTIDIAKSIFGRRIQAVYPGYRGQGGEECFVVGEIKREKYANGQDGEICLFTVDGRNTYFRAHKFNKGAFTCSDSDRFVYFVVVDESIELTRVYHQKLGGRVCDFLTNLSLEEVIAQNAFLQEPDRKIIKTKTEFHFINDNPKCIESFKNGILVGEYTDNKPSAYKEERAWNEFYQKTTGNPLPKGGILK